MIAMTYPYSIGTVSWYFGSIFSTQQRDSVYNVGPRYINNAVKNINVNWMCRLEIYGAIPRNAREFFWTFTEGLHPLYEVKPSVTFYSVPTYFVVVYQQILMHCTSRYMHTVFVLLCCVAYEYQKNLLSCLVWTTSCHRDVYPTCYHYQNCLLDPLSLTRLNFNRSKGM